MHIIAGKYSSATERHSIPGHKPAARSQFKKTAGLGVLRRLHALASSQGKVVRWYAAGDFNMLEDDVGAMCTQAATETSSAVHCVCFRNAVPDKRRDWVISNSPLEFVESPALAKDNAHHAIVVADAKPATPPPCMAASSSTSATAEEVAMAEAEAEAEAQLTKVRQDEMERVRLAEAAARMEEASAPDSMLVESPPNTPRLSLRDGAQVLVVHTTDAEVVVEAPFVRKDGHWLAPKLIPAPPVVPVGSDDPPFPGFSPTSEAGSDAVDFVPKRDAVEQQEQQEQDIPAEAAAKKIRVHDDLSQTAAGSRDIAEPSPPRRARQLGEVQRPEALKTPTTVAGPRDIAGPQLRQATPPATPAPVVGIDLEDDTELHPDDVRAQVVDLTADAAAPPRAATMMPAMGLVRDDTPKFVRMVASPHDQERALAAVLVCRRAVLRDRGESEVRVASMEAQKAVTARVQDKWMSDKDPVERDRMWRVSGGSREAWARTVAGYWRAAAKAYFGSTDCYYFVAATGYLPPP